MRHVIAWGLVALTAAPAGCAGHLFYPSGPFQGRVVDCETEQPLVGAAVVLVWYREAPGPGHPAEDIHDTAEVVTDGNGKFTVPRTTHVVFFGRVNRPYVIVYYPGYRDFLGQEGSESFTSITGGPVLVRLRRPAAAERRRFARIPTLAGGLPKEKIPNLSRLVEQEERALGFDR